MDNFDVFLSEISLTKIQADVYKYIIQKPGIKIGDIATELGINRSHLYSIAKKLISLELVYDDFEDKMRLYPSDIDVIKKLLTEKKERIIEKNTQFNENIDKYRSLFGENKYSSIKIRIYHGKAGRLEGIEKILNYSNANKELLLYSNQKIERNLFSSLEHDDFIQKRVKLNISIKVLLVNNEQGRELHSDSSLLRSVKILPDHFQFRSEVYVIENSILSFDLVPDIVGIYLESEQQATIQRLLFNSIFDSIS